MPLRTLRYFLTAAEEMNFRRAAEKLYITQQSLSAHIQRLERQYDVILFERKPRLMLTPAGQSMVEYARRALHTEAQLIASLADITRSSTGRLRVGITGTRGAVFLPKIWNAYHKRYPNIVITMAEGSTTQLDELLLDGKIDLYIAVNVPAHNNTQVIDFSRDRVYCIFSQGFLKASPKRWRDILCRPEGVDLTETAEIPLITFTRGNGLRRTLEDFFEEHDLHPHIIFETGRHDLVLDLCRLGHGIGLVYDMILYDALQREEVARELCARPIQGSLPQKFTQLTYRKESFRPRYLTGFIEAARRVFEEYASSIDPIIRNAANAERQHTGACRRGIG